MAFLYRCCVFPETFFIHHHEFKNLLRWMYCGVFNTHDLWWIHERHNTAMKSTMNIAKRPVQLLGVPWVCFMQRQTRFMSSEDELFLVLRSTYSAVSSMNSGFYSSTCNFFNSYIFLSYFQISNHGWSRNPEYRCLKKEDVSSKLTSSRYHKFSMEGIQRWWSKYCINANR